MCFLTHINIIYHKLMSRKKFFNSLSRLLRSNLVQYKNQNGYVYNTARYHMNKYLAFSTSQAPDESIPSKDTVNAFLNRYAGTPGNLYNIVAALREFSKYLIGLAYTSHISFLREKFLCQCPSNHINLQRVK